MEPADGRGEQRTLADDGYREAMARAGRLLTSRPRTERELTERLTSAGFDPRVVVRAIDRLRRLHLLDDLDFARRWIAERGAKRGRDVLLGELEAKGVARDVAEAVVDDCAPDQAATARTLAEARLRRWIHLPLGAQAARLYRFLGGRGFSEEVVEETVKSVLPPEGWD